MYTVFASTRNANSPRLTHVRWRSTLWPASTLSVTHHIHPRRSLCFSYRHCRTQQPFLQAFLSIEMACCYVSTNKRTDERKGFYLFIVGFYIYIAKSTAQGHLRALKYIYITLDLVKKNKYKPITISKLDLCGGGSFSTAIFYSDIQALQKNVVVVF